MQVQEHMKLGLYEAPEAPLDNQRRFKKKDVLRLIFGSKTEFDESLSVYQGKRTLPVP